MRAMVLAAGIGSRLEPLSNYIPKPLIHIGGRPVMEHILLLLKKHGFTDVISNTYHLADSIENYFNTAIQEQNNSQSQATKQADLSGIKLQFIREPQLSGVAGGIRRCSDFLKQSTACIIMGDALTDLDLGYIYKKHLEAASKGCIVTVAQMQIEDTRNFGVIQTDASNRIIAFQEKPKPEDAISNWASTGIYFFEPEVYEHLPSEAEAPFYDVAKNLFPDLLAKGKYMQAIAVPANTYWADIGTPDQYLDSLEDISKGKVKLELKNSISASAKIASDVELIGANEIADNVEIASGVRLENSIIWEGAKIAQGVTLTRCIVGPHAQVAANEKHSHQVLANHALSI